MDPHNCDPLLPSLSGRAGKGKSQPLRCRCRGRESAAPALTALRARIDALDADLLDLLARRYAVVAQIAQFNATIASRSAIAAASPSSSPIAATAPPPSASPPTSSTASSASSSGLAAIAKPPSRSSSRPTRPHAASRSSAAKAPWRLHRQPLRRPRPRAPDRRRRHRPASRRRRFGRRRRRHQRAHRRHARRHPRHRPRVRPDALLMDVTSIKAEPLAAMLAPRRQRRRTHPLFGPSVHSLQGQRTSSRRPRRRMARVAAHNARRRGLSVLETTAATHDQAMAVVQVLTHFSTEVMGRTLAALGVSIDDTLPFTSPIYLMELLMTARHFAQSPDLYAAIQMHNAATDQVTAAFVRRPGAARDRPAPRPRGVRGDVRRHRRVFRRLHGPRPPRIELPD